MQHNATALSCLHEPSRGKQENYRLSDLLSAVVALLPSLGTNITSVISCHSSSQGSFLFVL